MTSSVNPPGDQGADLAQPAPQRQTVIANINTYLVDGMSVLDQNGDEVGEVKGHSSAAGYLMVESGAFKHAYLYIPYRLIRSIDPAEIYVAEAKDILTSQYTQPPSITTVVEHQLVAGSDGGLTEQTRETQVTPSGYDDIPTPVNSVDAESTANRLAVGMLVYDVTGERLGELTQYFVSHSLLKVEKGTLTPRVLYIPFSAIGSIDPGAFTVYLSLPTDVVLKEYTTAQQDARRTGDEGTSSDKWTHPGSRKGATMTEQENTDRRQEVVENIATLLHVRQPVYDGYWKKVGAVKQFDLTAGYMQIHRGGPEPRTYYVPFRLIATIDPRHIYLTVDENALITYYSVLPVAKATLEEWTNWRTGETETIVGQRMQSGFSGEPVVAFQQTYTALASQLKAGMYVQDIDGKQLGALRQFDSRQGWMLVVNDSLGGDVLIIPFSAIARVETADYAVHLLVPEDRLHGDLAALLPSPATTAPVPAAAMGDRPHPPATTQ